MKLRLPDRFIRLCMPDAEGIATIGSRQVYIFPTGYGFVFALLLVLMLIGSINYANNLGFLLTFLLTGLGLVGMVHTWRNLVGLKLSSTNPKPVFKGEHACFRLRIAHRGAQEHPAIRLSFENTNASECDVTADGEAMLGINVKADRRGHLHIPRLSVSSRYPLGLFTAWSYVQLDATALVYPAPGERMPFQQQPAYRQSQQGSKGVGVEDFIGLRSYRQGDSPRHIHWKAAARGQELQVKQFGGDRAEQLWLNWAQLPFADPEQRLSALCRGILDAANKHFEYGLTIPGTELPPADGPAHQQRCLRALALYGETQ